MLGMTGTPRPSSSDRSQTMIGTPGALQKFYSQNQESFIRQPVVVLESGALVILTDLQVQAEPGMRWIGKRRHSPLCAHRLTTARLGVRRKFPIALVQCTWRVRQLKDKSYLGLFRASGEDSIYLSTSPIGIDWSNQQQRICPIPTRAFALRFCLQERVLVVYNHSSRADAQGRREGLYDDIAEAGDTRKNPGRRVRWERGLLGRAARLRCVWGGATTPGRRGSIQC